jgi:hypothetical protein
MVNWSSESQWLYLSSREIGISLPDEQRQQGTLHIQKDVLPYALYWLLCSLSPEALTLSLGRARGC